jgi:hypothetical protein
MQLPGRNETNLNLMRQTGNSAAQLPQYKLLWHCPSQAHTKVFALKSFWRRFNFSPGPTAELQFKWIYFILFAMAPFGVVFQ